MTKPLLHVLLGSALAFIAQGACAQDKKAADSDKPHATIESFHAQCIGCHGIPGYKTAFPIVYHVPMIAGQQPAYIVAALKAYRSGERSHPSMRGIAASMTDEHMQKLAEYYGAPHK